MRFSELLIAALLLVLPLSGGCGSLPTWAGGDPGAELVVDGEQDFEEDAYLGEPLVLDMRDPGISGYEFAGVSFDPAMFRLDSVLEEGIRARYEFTPLKTGEGLIEVRIRSQGGGPLQTYKRVRVTVGD